MKLATVIFAVGAVLVWPSGKPGTLMSLTFEVLERL
jgi:hypothetical protein